MDIFIAWSGGASHKLAEAFHKWLPYIISEAKPFLSSEDIRKGQRWFSEIGARLEKTNFAILCLTPQNLKSPWMHFEAGAVSKNISKGYVSALLLDTTQADLELPLSQFQHTPATKDEILKLLFTIDEALGTERRRGESHVRTLFEKFWPELETAIDQARQGLTASASATAPPARTERQILEGILDAQQGVLTRIANLEVTLGVLAATNASLGQTIFPFGRPGAHAAGGIAAGGGLLEGLAAGETQKLNDLLAKYGLSPSGPAVRSVAIAPARTQPKAESPVQPKKK